MLAFFAFGAVGFWLLLAAFVIAEIIMSERESYWVASFTVIVFGLILYFGSGVDFLSWIVANPFLMLGAFAGYVAMGVAWAFWKWIRLVKRALEEDREQRMKFLKKNDVKDVDESTKIPDDLRDKWKTWRYDHGRNRHYNWERAQETKGCRPKAKHYKSRLVGWATYWPFQMIASLLRDPFIWAIDTMKAQFEKVSQKIYGEDVVDFE